MASEQSLHTITMGLFAADAYVTDSRREPSLGAQALAGVVSILALVLAVRTAYRTLRSTVALVFWLIKWGAILYVVLLAYLWYTRETPTATQQALSSMHALVSGTCTTYMASSSTLFSLALRALQQPGGIGALAQQVLQLLNTPHTRTKSRSTARSTRTRRRNKPTDPLEDLLDSFGLREVYDVVQAWDPAAQAAAVEQDMRPKRKRERFWR